MAAANRRVTWWVIALCVLCAVAVVAVAVVTPLVVLERQQQQKKHVHTQTPRARTDIPPPTLPPGFRVDVNEPRIVSMPHFVTHAQAAHLIALAEKLGFGQSSVLVQGKTPRVIPARTSFSVFLKHAHDAVVRAVEAHAASVVGLPVSHLEPLQVVRYEPGQFYRTHFDAFAPTSPDVRRRGQRAVTIFVYLNDLPPHETGGGTRFANAGVTIRPERGKGVLWYNTRPNSQAIDERTAHSGEPVHVSRKYGLNIWFRDRPQDH